MNRSKTAGLALILKLTMTHFIDQLLKDESGSNRPSKTNDYTNRRIIEY